MFNRLILSAIALGLASTAAPAAAETTSVRVFIGDLNLSTESGRSALETRVEQAARNVCGLRPDLRDLRAMRSFNECVTDAVDSADEQVRIALESANTRRVAVLADKLGYVALAF